jgi:hypothetical protein
VAERIANGLDRRTRRRRRRRHRAADFVKRPAGDSQNFSGIEGEKVANLVCSKCRPRHMFRGGDKMADFCKINAMSLENYKGQKPSALQLPEEKICQVQADGDLLLRCLVPNSKDCAHAGFLNEVAYCLHPRRKEMQVSSQARAGG